MLTEVRERLRRLFKWLALVSPEDVETMRLSACNAQAGQWGGMKAAAHDAHPCASHYGRPSAVQIGYPVDLSLNADVTVTARDRAGL